jgi:uncharacterized protein YecT (DUF1311 family)/serine/threonine protein kinase
MVAECGVCSVGAEARFAHHHTRMPIDDPGLGSSELEQRYQILTELHRSATSRTYLARHLELNRDVTITIVQPADSAEAARVAADARVLSSIRHANIVPVIEGHALDDGTFAVVHARVRGSTLEQTLSAVGAMPLARVSATLQQVHDALECARTNGVTHRGVLPDALIFQQGSGRALVALDTVALATSGASEPCDDAHTLGSLAWSMLAGREDDGVTPLATLRPDLPAGVAENVDALRSCAAGAAVTDVSTRIATLIATLAAASPEPAVVAAAPATIIDSGPAAASARDTGPAVVQVKRSFGFGARMAAAIAVVVIIAALGLLMLRRRGTETAPLIQNASRDNELAGEVDSGSRPIDTVASAAPPAVPIYPRIVPPANMTPNAASGAAPVYPVDSTRMAPPTTVVPNNMGSVAPGMPGVPSTPASPIVPPETRRHEPPRTPPATRITLPTDSGRDSTHASMRDTSMPGVSAPRRDSSASTGDACSTPLDDSQRACLSSAIERNDAPLNDVYQRLIAGLRRQAAVADTEPDPPSVQQLRAAQREWLDRRDQTCRSVGQPPLYARERAQCFADQTAQRVRELQQQLASLP